MGKQAQMQHCAYCGEEMGVYAMPYDAHDTCGAPECERYAREADAAERSEAHERLDDERGWGRW